jgi:peptide chain release factor 1
MSSIIMEIRAGAGGDEAALFASDLFKMYSKYAENQGWQLKVLDSNEIGIGGLKSIIFTIKGDNAYDDLRYEGGVHRVQRVPETEKGNRIHTSTASVAVLKKPETAEIKINPTDIKMNFFKSSGPGGQNVNKRQTAVRLTHVPSGLVVSSQTTRNLEENKKNAYSILEAKLFRKQEAEIEAQVSGSRRNQIGNADRSEKIRTYNFPQDRITDHRIKKKWHNIEKILEGDLEPVIKKLRNFQLNS